MQLGIVVSRVVIELPILQYFSCVKLGKMYGLFQLRYSNIPLYSLYIVPHTPDEWRTMSHKNTPNEDPLFRSQHSVFPFQPNAEHRLGSSTNTRYDHAMLHADEPVMKINEFASIMGLISSEDDFPTAA